MPVNSCRQMNGAFRMFLLKADSTICPISTASLKKLPDVVPVNIAVINSKFSYKNNFYFTICLQLKQKLQKITSHEKGNGYFHYF